MHIYYTFLGITLWPRWHFVLIDKETIYQLSWQWLEVYTKILSNNTDNLIREPRLSYGRIGPLLLIPDGRWEWNGKTNLGSSSLSFHIAKSLRKPFLRIQLLYWLIGIHKYSQHKSWFSGHTFCMTLLHISLHH